MKENIQERRKKGKDKLIREMDRKRKKEKEKNDREKELLLHFCLLLCLPLNLEIFKNKPLFFLYSKLVY